MEEAEDENSNKYIDQIENDDKVLRHGSTKNCPVVQQSPRRAYFYGTSLLYTVNHWEKKKKLFASQTAFGRL